MLSYRRTTIVALSLFALAGAARADRPTFHAHHKDASGEEADHYKDEGEKPARAQVGKTLFQARALIGKNAVTDVDVTTGALDSNVAPPGRISELHVKAFRLDGKHQFEYEVEGSRTSGGAIHVAFPLPEPVKGARRGDDDDEHHQRDTHLARGQMLRLHVEAKGLRAGDEGEAEAKLEQMVKYRPDLSVASLDLPSTARLSTAVDISASVVELMRDTGAHADCVLAVDGTQVDQAPGIWVDANGAVTCHFVYTFKLVGKHAVTVSAANVIPGDYDGDNNALSGSIQIVNPAVMAYVANAVDVKSDSQFTQDVYASGGTTPDQHTVRQTVRRSQSRTLNGTIPAAINFPLKRVGYADRSDGVSLSTLSFTDVAADNQGTIADPHYDSLTTVARFDAGSGGWFSLRRYQNTSTGLGVTNLTFSFYGGDVTYHSEGFCKSVAGIFSCAGGDYTVNTTTPGAIFGAPRVALGSNYSADVIVDDGTAYEAHPALPLSTVSRSVSAPAACYNSTVNGTPSRVCMQSMTTTSVTTGSLVYTPPPSAQ